MVISSAGLVTVTKAGSAEFRVTNSSESKTLMLVSGTAASTAYVSTLTSGEDLRLQANGGLTTAVGGIVDSTGPLKENLLSNSGLSVWSNSTLVEVTSGAAPVTVGANAALVNNLLTNGGFDSATTSWTVATWSGAGTGSFTSVAPPATGATGNAGKLDSTAGRLFAYQNVTVEVGKLYQFSAWGKDGTGSGSFVLGSSANGSEQYTGGMISLASVGGAYKTFTFEATSTTAYVSLISNSVDDSYFDSVCLYEVTPGTVGNDTKAPDGWSKNGSHTIQDLLRHQESETLASGDRRIKGLYGVKWTNQPSHTWSILEVGNYTEDSWVKRFQGRKVTFGVWVYDTSGDDDNCRIAISDGVTTTYSAGGYATSDEFVWLEVTATIGTTVTEVRFQLDCRGGAGDVSYWSQPIVSLGSAIGEGNYSKPSGEIVWFESAVASNKFNVTTGWSDAGWLALNNEADSNGAIPKGAKAVAAQVRVNDSASSSGAEANVQLAAYADGGNNREFAADVLGIADDKPQRTNGWVPCNSTGDFDYVIGASGSATLDIPLFNYYGVQLR